MQLSLASLIFKLKAEKVTMPAKLDYPRFKQPSNDSIKIWRYMDFAKFVSLISTGRLYFPRADTLLDKYEGSIPRANKNVATENGRSIPKKHRLYMLKKTHISCWYASENESAAMWELYTLSGQGLAIKSSYSKFAELLPYCKESPIYLGKVRYINYEKKIMKKDNDSLLPFTYKRKAFKHEKEIRAIFVLPEGAPQHNMIGRPVKIDVNQLIEDIYLAPGSANWFMVAVNAVKDMYKIEAKLHRSSLDALEPFYGGTI